MGCWNLLRPMPKEAMPKEVKIQVEAPKATREKGRSLTGKPHDSRERTRNSDSRRNLIEGRTIDDNSR